MIIMKDSEIRKIAKTRVEFREHVYAYILVNIFLFVINMWFSPGFWWFTFVLFFWGIGLVFHYNEAYYGGRDTKIENEYQKLLTAILVMARPVTVVQLASHHTFMFIPLSTLQSLGV